MMRKIGIVFVVFVLIYSSCDKKTEEPQFSGEILLSSQLLQSGQSYAFYGFSFETGMISTYSLTSSSKPDLVAQDNNFNNTVDLLSSNDQDAFYKNGLYQSAEEAEANFNNYTEVIATEFQPLAQTIKENEIWTVQTSSKRFAKIWIKEISFQKGNISDYADIKIQYDYQPDGSRTFDCDCE